MNKKVLLVDDEKEFLDVLSERMQGRGLDVTASSDPGQALELARTAPVDVIVLDLKMPGMDGIEFLRAIKQDRPELQVILLTGHASVDKGIQAVRLGALDVLEKPANFGTLMERIERASAKKLVLLEKQDQEKIQEIITQRGW
jgi:DNA-binding NtrC family response regulator